MARPQFFATISDDGTSTRAPIMASFLGNLMKGGGDATAVRKKKFSEGTLRYDLFKKAQETLNVRKMAGCVMNEIAFL